jgi:hypothetical protein
MLGTNTFYVPNGSQVEARIPIQQGFFITLKGTQLARSKCNPQQRFTSCLSFSMSVIDYTVKS